MASRSLVGDTLSSQTRPSYVCKPLLQVRVEVRESTSQGFAAREYKPMRFRKFMEGFVARNELHYLTTEAVCEDEQGRLEVISPPVRENRPPKVRRQCLRVPTLKALTSC